MISLNQIVITENQVTKGGQTICTNVRPVKEYKDGKPTDNVIGYNYTVVCPSNKYEQFSIKVEQQQPVITPEELESKGGSVKVKVKNFEGRFYQNAEKQILFTAKATAIEVAP